MTLMDLTEHLTEEKLYKRFCIQINDISYLGFFAVIIEEETGTVTFLSAFFFFFSLFLGLLSPILNYLRLLIILSILCF